MLDIVESRRHAGHGRLQTRVEQTASSIAVGCSGFGSRNKSRKLCGLVNRSCNWRAPTRHRFLFTVPGPDKCGAAETCCVGGEQQTGTDDVLSVTCKSFKVCEDPRVTCTQIRRGVCDYQEREMVDKRLLD